MARSRRTPATLVGRCSRELSGHELLLKIEKPSKDPGGLRSRSLRFQVRSDLAATETILAADPATGDIPYTIRARRLIFESLSGAYTSPSHPYAVRRGSSDAYKTYVRRDIPALLPG
jgi:hypothetical protein